MGKQGADLQHTLHVGSEVLVTVAVLHQLGIGLQVDHPVPGASWHKHSMAAVLEDELDYGLAGRGIDASLVLQLLQGMVRMSSTLHR